MRPRLLAPLAIVLVFSVTSLLLCGQVSAQFGRPSFPGGGSSGRSDKDKDKDKGKDREKERKREMEREKQREKAKEAMERASRSSRQSSRNESRRETSSRGSSSSGRGIANRPSSSGSSPQRTSPNRGSSNSSDSPSVVRPPLGTFGGGGLSSPTGGASVPENARPAPPARDNGVGPEDKLRELPKGQPGDDAEQERQAREERRQEREQQEREEAEAREKQEREAQTLAAMQEEISRLQNANDSRAAELRQEYLRREKQLRDEVKEREEKKDRERKRKELADDNDNFFRRPMIENPAPKPVALAPNPQPMAVNPIVHVPQPLTDEQFVTVLEDLNSGNLQQELQALATLAQAKPSGDVSRVATLIAKHLDPANPEKRKSAAKALAIWCTPTEVPLLIELLGEPDKEARVAVIHALGKLAAPQSAGPLADRLSEDRTAATAALVAIGGDAVPSMIQRLAHDNMWVRAAAIDILDKVGDEAAAEALGKVVRDDAEELIRNKANEVLRRHGARWESGAIK